VLPESAAKAADFLFREPNILAELKTLEEDARREHAAKLTGLVNDWTRGGLIRVYGRVQLSPVQELQYNVRPR
jgi:hypothetical protein